MKPETTYSAVIGKILAQKRKERGWDQAAIAKKTGINRSSWSRLENGETAPDALQLSQIAKVFDMMPQDLLAEVEKVCAQLKDNNIKVHMTNVKNIPKKTGNKFGWLLVGAALTAIIAALATSGKDSDDA